MNVKSHSIVGWELSWSEIGIRKIEQVILIKSDGNKETSSINGLMMIPVKVRLLMCLEEWKFVWQRLLFT